MSDPDALLHDFQSITESLLLRELFFQQQPTELEIGCGDGGFLLEYAQRHPERNFLGVERLLGRVRKLSKRGQRIGLTNLRLLRIEARYVLDYLLPEHAFSAVHIYFPDPWPKAKHARHRLIQSDFLPRIHRILTPGGVLYLRTDDSQYFGQMQDTFSDAEAFTEESTPTALSEITTEFERQWIAEGKRTFYAAYRHKG
ncbi:MAG: tRNA (guanosine(46)-N7)-methyltransferase TrmB [Verrucomicrobiales bacterium]|nr:tRNA (guanosine(46)-N7)-methyltransferase TrmB [Verrucomicrobiales bacterium]|tara:strand:+ start:4951 stop:5547 length:597 start_codon:yes stop_codon:yes gene_type:complete